MRRSMGVILGIYIVTGGRWIWVLCLIYFGSSEFVGYRIWVHQLRCVCSGWPWFVVVDQLFALGVRGWEVGGRGE